MPPIRLWVSFVVSCLGACSTSPAPAEEISDSSKIGINLAGINYYATQTPFTDVFRSRDEWATTDGVTWDTEMADSVPVDADGYPLEIPYQGQMMRTAVFQPFEAGTFSLSWEGDGEVSVQGPGLVISSRKDRSVKFSVKRATDEPMFVRIERSSAENRVRNIRVVSSSNYHATFQSAVEGFRVLRFMDWGATNGNPVEKWSERTTPGEAQGSVRGASIETMVDTANELHADMWYTVPHKADDDFMQQAAELIGARLAKDLKVYVEYSNENWNAIFSQVAWQQQRGLEERLNAGAAADDSADSQSYDAGLKFSIRRAAQAHVTFRRVLGESRVIAVVGGQSASSGLNDQLLSFYADREINPLGGHPDVLAIAPYFGQVYRPGDVDSLTLTVDDLLDDTEALIETSVGGDTRANRRVADKHDVGLIAYEAGQHMLALGGLENDPAFVQRLIAANRDARMGRLYRKAHEMWLKNGGGLAVYFNSCQTPSKYGTWGALEYQNQPLSKAPKMGTLKALVSGL